MDMLRSIFGRIPFPRVYPLAVVGMLVTLSPQVHAATFWGLNQSLQASVRGEWSMVGGGSEGSEEAFMLERRDPTYFGSGYGIVDSSASGEFPFESGAGFSFGASTAQGRIQEQSISFGSTTWANLPADPDIHPPAAKHEKMTAARTTYSADFLVLNDKTLRLNYFADPSYDWEGANFTLSFTNLATGIVVWDFWQDFPGCAPYGPCYEPFSESVELLFLQGRYRVQASGAAFADSGQYRSITTTQGFNLTPVPEPSTYVLMGLGLAGIGFVARRRFRRN